MADVSAKQIARELDQKYCIRESVLFDITVLCVCRFTPGERIKAAPPKPSGPSAADMARIRVSPSHYPLLTFADPLHSVQEAIAGARSLEEVQRLEAMLRAGQLPGQPVANGGIEEEEMD